MLKTVTVAIAISVGLAGVAMAQMVRPPVPAHPGGALLVKHDKDDNGHGRKLGHYKNRRGGDDDNETDAEDRTRRSSARSSRGATAPAWVNPAQAPYYAPPGYGNSYSPTPYGYYPPPSYYRGY
jgi:hypothetical protein